MGFLYRSWIKNQGWPHDLFDGRRVIWICNTWSELTPCNAHFRELGDHVIAQRLIQLDVDDETLARRRAQWTAPPVPERGWERLYVEHVQQAHLGGYLDFLVGHSELAWPATLIRAHNQS